MPVHIYAESKQSAVKFMDYTFDPPMVHGYGPRKLIYTECCSMRHRAENIVVQCYYDGWRFWCAQGHGCKDPEFIAARERRAFRNRSNGQKRRWLKSSIKNSE